MYKIVITGGCGFIGANLVQLLSAGRNQITVVDNLSRGSLEYIGSVAHVEIFEYDIRDGESMTKAFHRKDVAVHLAAYGSVVESVADPNENFSINVGGTFNVLRAAKSSGIKKLIFASTGGALIGNATPPVNEDSAPRPISPYGASKLAGEGYCSAFAHSYDMDIICLRFANIIGPFSWHKKGAVTAFFKAILSGEPITIYGDGTATRDFLYVDDLCRGIEAAIKSSLTGFHVFHLASGREVSVIELAELCRKIAGVPEYPIIFKNKRKGEVERNFADYALAKEKLNFEPKVSLEDGLKLTWEWFRETAGKEISD